MSAMSESLDSWQTAFMGGCSDPPIMHHIHSFSSPLAPISRSTRGLSL